MAASSDKQSVNHFEVINEQLRKEKNFLFFILIAIIITGLCYPYPRIAMWVGFGLAGYSAVANDSIQTIGTFIASNAGKKWWFLWIFIGGIFLATITYSWIAFDGDVSFQRLANKGFSQAPTSFNYLQIAAPLVLLILTRLRMPVSTTFLLLSSFSTQTGAVMSVMQKSMMGYVIAFILAIVIWLLLSRLIHSLIKGAPHPGWTVAQWVISGGLWCLWIIQDAANIAVYLPRQLSFIQFSVFALTIFIGLGALFYMKGDKIQQLVEEKSEVKDVRQATIIDFVYCIILFFFTTVSTVPMSTTWVFIGLLGGRELGKKIVENMGHENLRPTFKMIFKDVSYAMIGLGVSILLALLVNPVAREELMASF